MAFSLTSLNFWRTPSDFLRTTGGMRTPGWESLLQNIQNHFAFRAKFGRKLK